MTDIKSQRIIVLQNLKNPYHIEYYGSLPKICENHTDINFHAIKGLKSPFIYNGWIFRRIEKNQLTEPFECESIKKSNEFKLEILELFNNLKNEIKKL